MRKQIFEEVGGASNIFCPGATKHLVMPLQEARDVSRDY